MVGHLVRNSDMNKCTGGDLSVAKRTSEWSARSKLPATESGRPFVQLEGKMSDGRPPRPNFGHEQVYRSDLGEAKRVS